MVKKKSVNLNYCNLIFNPEKFYFMKKILLKLFPLLGIAVLLTACPAEEVPHVAEPLRAPMVAVMVDEGFHDGEAYMPIGYLTNQGMDITVIGPAIGTVEAYNSDFTIAIESAVADVSVDNFDALLLPGGEAPASLSEVPAAVEFAREFFETGRPVAAICHGPLVLIAANVVDGLTCTGVGGIQDELEEAGATYRDEEVVIDGNLITSRTPPDLPAFSKALGEAVLESFDPDIPRAIPPQPGI